MNFARTFRLKERLSLQVRAEFQNVFNRTFLPTPQIAGLNFTAAPTVSGGRYTAGFGTFGNLRAANVFGTQGGGRSGVKTGRYCIARRQSGPATTTGRWGPYAVPVDS